MTSTATRPLNVGLVLPHWTALPLDVPHWSVTELPAEVPRWADLLALAQQVETAGFDSLWLVDHLLIRWAVVAAQFGREVLPALAAAAPVGVWECWSLLAALAAVTERITLGSAGQLHQLPQSRAAGKNGRRPSTRSADGRLILGLGAGDFADEHHTFGFPWDHRVSRFAEALQIVQPLLRCGRVDFAGELFPGSRLRAATTGTPPGRDRRS